MINRGAEIIAWPVWGCNPEQARARACENHVYVVSSTYSAPEQNWMPTAIFGHAGERLAEAKEWGDVIVADLDGVVVVPRRAAHDVLVRCEKLVGTENAVRHAVKLGMTPLAAYDKFGSF